MGVAVGQMGLSREEYLDLTPSEFSAIHRRWKEMVQKNSENELWQKLYVARLQLFRQLCPPKGNVIKITDLWEMPDEMEARKAKLKKAVENREADKIRMMKRFGT